MSQIDDTIVIGDEDYAAPEISLPPEVGQSGYFASVADVITGTNTTKIVTPKVLAQVLASKSDSTEVEKVLVDMATSIAVLQRATFMKKVGLDPDSE